MRSVKQQPLFQKSVFFLEKHCFAYGAKIFTQGFKMFILGNLFAGKNVKGAKCCGAKLMG